MKNKMLKFVKLKKETPLKRDTKRRREDFDEIMEVLTDQLERMQG